MRYAQRVAEQLAADSSAVEEALKTSRSPVWKEGWQALSEHTAGSSRFSIDVAQHSPLWRTPTAFHLSRRIDLGWLRPYAVEVGRAIRRVAYPPNLHDVPTSREDDITQLAAEGLPVYGVPRSKIVLELLDARSEEERRTVIEQHVNEILDDCSAALDRCIGPESADSVSFARDAIAAARDRHLRPAQALAANLLDTLVRKVTDPELRQAMTGRAAIDGIDERYVLVRWVVVPIRQGHSRFFPDKGDPIPTAFTRHATVHAVSRAQYSTSNALVVIMLVTSLLAWQNDPGRMLR